MVVYILHRGIILLILNTKRTPARFSDFYQVDTLRLQAIFFMDLAYNT